MIVVVMGGEVFTPAPPGRVSVLILKNAIGHVGMVDPAAFGPARHGCRDAGRGVVSGGRVLMRDGVMAQQDRFLQTSARRIHLDGHEA